MNLRIGITLVVLALAAAVLGPWLVPADPRSQDLALRLAGPTLAHPFGLDELGRDILARPRGQCWPAALATEIKS